MSELVVGGQAVIEGVMMRSPKALAVAVRRPSGEIAVQEMGWKKVFPDWKFLRWPLIRGAVVLVESMSNGYRALNFANEQAFGQEEEELSKGSSISAIAVAIVLGVLLFIAAPQYGSVLVGSLVGTGTDVGSFSFHFVTGLLKLTIFFGYVALIGRIPDMRRVFQYHGAEHKSIYAYEAGLELTVENAREQVRFHPRCGTAFIFAVAGIAILFWSAVFPLLQPFLTFSENTILQNFIFVLVKIPMMIPIAGLAYEFTRFSGKSKESGPLLRILTAPGLWLQRLTTREPDDKQLEVALAALRMTLAREQNAQQAKNPLTVYPSYQAIDLPVL